MEYADLGLKEQIRISTYLRHIVAAKSHRFAKLCGKLRDHGMPKSKIFETITQPEAQMETILGYLGHFFENGREGKDVNIVLLRPDQEAGCFRYFMCYPKDYKPTLPEDRFWLNRGVAGTALDSNDLVVVDDIEKDVKKDNSTFYTHDNILRVRPGSIACLPIFDNERAIAPLVLSVRVGEIDVFTEDDKDHIRGILEPFAQRILLEERLRYLKHECSLGE